MAAHYTNVTQEEIEEFLFPQDFKKIAVSGTSELVYAKRVDRDGLQLSLRVYSGIAPSGQSRSVGTDAIRVTLFMRAADGKVAMLGGSKRVHRVAGWRANLQKRVSSWEESLPDRKCPKCGNPLVIRKGKNGEFYGCTHYPECRHTEQVQKYVLSAKECAAEAEIQEIEGGQM